MASQVALVVEYQTAPNVVEHVHRVGRTARAGRAGRASPAFPGNWLARSLGSELHAFLGVGAADVNERHFHAQRQMLDDELDRSMLEFEASVYGQPQSNSVSRVEVRIKDASPKQQKKESLAALIVGK